MAATSERADVHVEPKGLPRVWTLRIFSRPGKSGRSTTSLYFVGELGWLVGLLAVVIALYAGGSPRLPLVLLVLSACVLFVFDHPAPTA